MRKEPNLSVVMLLLAATSIVAVACSSGGDDFETGTGKSLPLPDAGEEGSTPAGEAEADTEEADAPAAVELAQLEAPLTWSFENIDTGIKPALALDSNDAAHISYIVEAQMGGVFYATNAGGSFEIQTIAEGYFYGPEDIAVTAEGVPYVAYHDHQDSSFKPDLGDEVIAVSDGSSWDLLVIEHPGHDGWDNDIVVDANGNWHTASVDPSQFGSQDGVEYATNAGGPVTVESTGSGPIKYEFGVGIQIAPDGSPTVAYYNDRDEQLELARRSGGSWSVEVVDAEGDAGRYASLAYDPDGDPHIAYFVLTDQTAGVVRHAWWDGASWQTEDVGRLENLRQGMAGARNVTALAIDGDGVLRLAYNDLDQLFYAQNAGDGWAGQIVAESGDRKLGQLVEMALDSEGMPHLVYYEVTSFSPLQGEVLYASAAAG